ncbi:hypothetical protein FKX85_01900 [Echinicola soli]|uniref:Uncharacterized protein n=1 Tax=Echinicola soli TaxID=2591634 RepID=A0A514CDH3_9BACT|nr:hypothetical protein [Echinicola soli]QDH77863.1 hypothetical protein FKX85_01900 [Echinicola soli]
MKTSIFTISTDTVNRYGSCMTIGALYHSLFDNFKDGIPLLFNHDQHKLLGWGKTFGLYLEPGLSRLLVLHFVPETQYDKNIIIQNNQAFKRNRQVESTKQYLEPFKKILEDKYVNDYKVFYQACAYAIKRGVVKQIFPDLFQKKDRDGLVPLGRIFKDFEYLGNGVFKNLKTDFVIVAHKYFRRSESIQNTLNVIFLNKLIEYYYSGELEVYLRIDEDMVGYSPSFTEYAELDYQWGPKYNDEIKSIKEGVSKHIINRDEQDIYDISGSEFLWEWDKEKRRFSFQMEEIKNEESRSDKEIYNCRYVHTIYDKVDSSLVHFDGAIRSYSTQDMLGRIDTPINVYGKKAGYTKLFKINGNLGIADWKLMVTLFLRDNPLIYEYFGKSEELEMLKAPYDLTLSLRQKLVPYEIKKEDGLRFQLSHFTLPKDLRKGRYIHTYDIIASKEREFKCIDFFTIEIRKALQRIGGDLEIPDDVLLIKTNDGYWNIPLIMHNGIQSEKLFLETLRAVQLLFDGMIEKEIDLNIAINLGLVIDEVIIQFGIYGSINEIVKWFKGNFVLPTKRETVVDWLEKQKKYVGGYERRDTPIMDNILQKDGVIYAKRTLLEFDYEFKLDENENENLIFEVENIDLQKYFDNGLIISYGYSVDKCVCSDSKESYIHSCRSKWFDSDLPAVEITESTPLFLFWS